MCHLATSLCASPFLESLLRVLFFSLLSGSVLTVHVFFLSFTDGCCPAYRTCGSLRAQRCTFCCCPDWVPERVGLVWSGTCRWGHDKQKSVIFVVFTLCSFYSGTNYIWWYALTQHRAAPIWCLEKGWWGYKTVCSLGLSSHLTQEEKRWARQEIK